MSEYFPTFEWGTKVVTVYFNNHWLFLLLATPDINFVRFVVQIQLVYTTAQREQVMFIYSVGHRKSPC